MTVSKRSAWRLAALAAAATGMAAWVLTAHAGTGAARAAAPTSFQLKGGFLDSSSGDYLRIELSPAAPDRGAFVLSLPGTGLVWPNGRAVVTPEGAGSTLLRYDGAGSEDPTARLDRELGVGYQQVGPGHPVTVKLMGRVDPAQGTGSVEAWVNGEHFRLDATAAPPVSASAAVQAYLGALERGDWTAIYAKGDDDLRKGATEADFVKGMANAPGATGILSATAGPPAVSTTAAGITFATSAIHLTYRANAPSPSRDGTLVLVRNGAGWKVFTVK